MDSAYQEIIRRRLELPLHEGLDRTATPEEAVRRHVEPGDTRYLGAAHGRANAAVREIARQWWGKTPGFTLAAVGIGSPWTALIHGNLARRTITTFMGEGYPLTGVFDNRPEAQAVEAARAARGWDLAVAPRLRRFEAPTADELGLIRLFDPPRYFLG